MADESIHSPEQLAKMLDGKTDAEIVDGVTAMGVDNVLGKIFEGMACINCHNVAGTVANGRFGPDLTHLMSRETIASGAVPNTPGNLRLWIQNPNALKPGSRMPAMKLTDRELDWVTAYLASLK